MTRQAILPMNPRQPADRGAGAKAPAGTGRRRAADRGHPRRDHLPDPRTVDHGPEFIAAAGPVVWYQSAGRRLIPRERFQLSPGVIVADVARFLETIEAEIRQGPQGPRAGPLLAELDQLRKLFNRPLSP